MEKTIRLPIGICGSFRRKSGLPHLQCLVRQGYRYIDYQDFVDIESDFFRQDFPEFAETLEEQKRILEKIGLGVSQAHAPWRWPVQDSTAEGRSQWLEAMKKAVCGCRILGCPVMVVHPLLPFGPTPDHPEQVFAVNDAFFAELAAYAKTQGVVICAENMPWPEFPLASVEAIAAMVDRIGSDNLFVCLDTGHAAIFKKENVWQDVHFLGHRLKALHLHDNLGDGDSHMIPGAGIIQWDAFAYALRQIGFRGVLSLESSIKRDRYSQDEWERRELSLAAMVTDLAEKATGG